MEKIVCISGYFDPLHVGHLEYMENAKKIGGNHAKLMIIVNNDQQAQLKKGSSFMPCDERIKIIQALRVVDLVIKSIDQDRTVCQTLATITPKPDYFCNGGDQNNQSIPEAPICQQLGIELVDGLGDKIQSSSWLIRGARQSLTEK